MGLTHHDNISSLFNRSTVHSLSAPKQRPVRPVPQLRRFHSLLRDRPETSHLDLSGSWISPRCRGSAAESRWRPVIVGAVWMNRSMSKGRQPSLQFLWTLSRSYKAFAYLEYAFKLGAACSLASIALCRPVLLEPIPKILPRDSATTEFKESVTSSMSLQMCSIKIGTIRI